MDTILTDAEAADLLRRFTQTPPRKSRVGRHLIMFRDSDGPFFMTEGGHKTVDWRNAVLYDTVDEAQDFLIQVVATPLPRRLRPSEGYARKDGNTFDNIFLRYRRTARIYEIRRELPERWVTNGYTIRVLRDGTLDLHEPEPKGGSPRAIPVLNANRPVDTYGTWSARA